MSRRSSGLGELSRVLDSPEPLCVLDLGATSANNIRFFTGRSHRIYSEDLLLASVDPSLRIKDDEVVLAISFSFWAVLFPGLLLLRHVWFHLLF